MCVSNWVHDQEASIVSDHTSAPWQIDKVRYRIKGDGEKWIVENTIHTAYDHPQLRGPAPVVTLSTSVGLDGKALHSVYVTDANAAHIVECVNAHERLVAENEKLRAFVEAVTEYRFYDHPFIEEGDELSALKETLSLLESAARAALGEGQ